MTIEVTSGPAPVEERLGIGGNAPPLDELLSDETTADRKRMTELVEAANNAVIKNGEDQQRVTTLAAMIGTHSTKVEADRVARKKPFDDMAATVQRIYKAILDPLAQARTRLRTLNDAYEAEQERAREAERRRLAEEEERQRKAAEEAERKAEEAKAAGQSGLKAELAAIQARDAAEAAARAREEVRAAPVRTDIGMASQSTVRSFVIDDLTLCLRYLVRNQKVAVTEAIEPIVRRLGRAKVDIPGVRIVEQKLTRFGR